MRLSVLGERGRGKGDEYGGGNQGDVAYHCIVPFNASPFVWSD